MGILVSGREGGGGGGRSAPVQFTLIAFDAPQTEATI